MSLNAGLAPELDPKKRRRVLGLDPGTRHFGWGIVEKVGLKYVHIAHGVIHTDLKALLGFRLVQIETELCDVIKKYAPTEAGIESLFFAKDAQAAAKLGHARGVALLVCTRSSLPIGEYPPSRVKRTVAGIGRAEKKQVAKMVSMLLRLDDEDGLAVDASDALAVAITQVKNSVFDMKSEKTFTTLAQKKLFQALSRKPRPSAFSPAKPARLRTPSANRLAAFEAAHLIRHSKN